ncbi:MAG: hypothetical protein EOO77_32240 [Oxalobacteraceae bacterium]|nr:MAG: hypothetical protein EOO77_32240 [Oxalobacteraceae bacterium]
MTVEDAIEILGYQLNRGLFSIEHHDEWAYKFVTNVSEYTKRDKPLSTEQARIILKVIRRTRDYLIANGVPEYEIDSLLLNPQYRQAPYPSANVPREVRFLGDNLLGFRFKRNDAIALSIQGLSAAKTDSPYRLSTIWFHRDYRVWVVPITRHNLDDAMDVIRDHRFAFDDAVADYLTACSNHRGRPAAFAADDQMIAGQIYDCEVLAWWTRTVLGGSLV